MDSVQGSGCKLAWEWEVVENPQSQITAEKGGEGNYLYLRYAPDLVCM